MCEKLGPLDTTKTKSFPVNMKCIVLHLELQDSLDMEAMPVFLSSQKTMQSDP